MAISSVDVARRAGVSTAVVSYVFNDGPRGVAPATREKVLRAATELGYRPNRVARALRSGATGFIGILTPDSSIPFFAELTRALVSALGERGLLALVSHAGISGRNETQTIEALLSAQIDGLLVIAFWQESHSGIHPNVPVVYVHHRPSEAIGGLVTSDNEHATLTALDHLHDVHGIEDPWLWTGPDDLGPLGERTRAWSKHRGGDERQIIRSHFSASDSERVFLEYARQKDLPRALVVATDQQAVGILAGAYAAGIRIPDDLAIVSLDGTPESAFTAPALTVVQQPLDLMAKDAISLMLGEATQLPPRQGKLVPRRSCGCSFDPTAEAPPHRSFEQPTAADRH